MSEHYGKKLSKTIIVSKRSDFIFLFFMEDYFFYFILTMNSTLENTSCIYFQKEFRYSCLEMSNCCPYIRNNKLNSNIQQEYLSECVIFGLIGYSLFGTSALIGLFISRKSDRPIAFSAITLKKYSSPSLSFLAVNFVVLSSVLPQS